MDIHQELPRGPCTAGNSKPHVITQHFGLIYSRVIRGSWPNYLRDLCYRKALRHWRQRTLPLGEETAPQPSLELPQPWTGAVLTRSVQPITTTAPSHGASGFPGLIFFPQTGPRSALFHCHIEDDKRPRSVQPRPSPDLE